MGGEGGLRNKNDTGVHSKAAEILGLNVSALAVFLEEQDFPIVLGTEGVVKLFLWFFG